MPLNSFHRCSHTTTHVFNCSIVKVHLSQFVTAAGQFWQHYLTALPASSVLRCSFRHDCWKVPEIWMINFGSQTKLKKNTQQKKQNILQIREPPWKWNKIISVINILFTSLNFHKVCWPAYIAKNCCASRLHDDKLKYNHPMNVYSSKKLI